jgi:hypothetical protein
MNAIVPLFVRPDCERNFNDFFISTNPHVPRGIGAFELRRL